MKSIKVGILDLNAGNIFSVYKVLNQITKNVEIIENYDSSKTYSHIVIPGVASFGAAMKTFKEKNFDSLINDFIINQKPILGLCVGCQILFGSSLEFSFSKGLDLINGKVEKLPSKKYIGAKLPNVGWFRINFNSNNKLFKTVNKNDFFYFTHSFHCIPNKNENILATYNFYKEKIVAAVIHNNIIGLQFHPELSSYAGKKILKNFLKI